MSIDLHDGAVLILVGMILLNMIVLMRARDVRVYAKQMRILMPISVSMIATVIFTGMVMMAAKQLSFTVENIVMILFSIVLIVLEVKRYGILKRLNLGTDNALTSYKAKAIRLMGIALLGSLLISGWMLV